MQEVVSNTAISTCVRGRTASAFARGLPPLKNSSPRGISNCDRAIRGLLGILLYGKGRDLHLTRDRIAGYLLHLPHRTFITLVTAETNPT